ncbi:MAG: hypothetical protein CMJ76_16880 [Planctomycetaceae bacterium]|nr:hypothetical protein [Planctomycetaceae bacterium]
MNQHPSSCESNQGQDTRQSVETSASTLMAYLRLMRIGNVFTAFANIIMGFLVVQSDAGLTGITGDNAVILLGLLASTFCLYCAGMVLNDVFDVERDTSERKKRPIPSGQISLGNARKLGWGLLVSGILCSLTAGINGLIIASAVAISVVLYDWILKKTHLAPLAMGACRFFNILLGMSMAGSDSALFLGFAKHHLLIAGSIGIFVSGLTWFARTEAKISSRWLLIFGVLVMAIGLYGLAIFPRYVPDPKQLRLNANTATMLIGLLGMLTLYRCVLAVADPIPAKVQTGVIGCLRSLIFLDAAVVLIVSDRMLAIGTLALLVPMLIIGKRIRAT